MNTTRLEGLEGSAIMKALLRMRMCTPELVCDRSAYPPMLVSTTGLRSFGQTGHIFSWEIIHTR